MQTKPIPAGLLVQILSPEIQKRFWSKVEINGRYDCWPWKASLKGKNGYGQVGFWYRKKRFTKSSHKIAWISRHKKDVPVGKLVLHSCKANKRCCNPAQLRHGTKSDNGKDSVADGTCCLCNRGEKHPCSKLYRISHGTA